MNHGHQFDAALSEECKAEQERRLKERLVRAKLDSAAPDLLDTLKRAYFLLEINNIKDIYFEALRIKLGELLPSQIVSEERMIAAIKKAKQADEPERTG